MSYVCLHQHTFIESPYTILPLRSEDIYLIKQWRNEQIEHLRQNVILTDEMQKNYYETVIKPSFNVNHPQQILFSFFYNQYLIGYGGIVHIDWVKKEGEISFLVDTQRGKQLTQYSHDFKAFLNLIKIVAFKELKFERIFTETYAIRPHHMAILETSGFNQEKLLKNHVKINEKFVDAFIHGCMSDIRMEK